MLYTKIVCTIGPSSREPEMLASLMQAGMDVARLNMSHGSQAYHAENIQRIRAVAAEVGKTVAVLIDLQGPKLRVGRLPDGGVMLEIGQQVRLTIKDVPATPEQIPVQFQRLPQTVHVGDRILLDDGLLELAVTERDDVSATCRVITGGLLTSNKGMNLPNADLSIASISEKDQEDLIFALEHRVDWIALSFVRRATEVQTLKDLIRERSPYGRATPVIAKIEKPEAMDNIESIIKTSDGIMVARGDLGIETSPEEVPIMQKQIIRRCNEAGIPVITATQMLDSMVRNPRPTRAEASDVANAILDGSDAIMLSGETAVGKYPARAVQTMARIASQAEQHMDIRHSMPSVRKDCTITEAVCHAATDTVHVLKASAVLAPTVSGKTARTLAQFRPPCPIIAITPNPSIQHQLALYWGVRPLLSRRAPDTDRVIEDAVAVALESGMIDEGDTVVITAGTGGAAPGVTDLIKVYTLAKTLAYGTGVGTSVVAGRVRRVDSPLTKGLHIANDEIVVTRKTDRSYVPVLRNAAGLISGEGGQESHCFLLATELGLPAIVGIDNIDVFSDGQWVILDPEQGVVRERLGKRS